MPITLYHHHHRHRLLRQRGSHNQYKYASMNRILLLIDCCWILTFILLYFDVLLLGGAPTRALCARTAVWHALFALQMETKKFGWATPTIEMRMPGLNSIVCSQPHRHIVMVPESPRKIQVAIDANQHRSTSIELINDGVALVFLSQFSCVSVALQYVWNVPFTLHSVNSTFSQRVRLLLSLVVIQPVRHSGPEPNIMQFGQQKRRRIPKRIRVYRDTAFVFTPHPQLFSLLLLGELSADRDLQISADLNLYSTTSTYVWLSTVMRVCVRVSTALGY